MAAVPGHTQAQRLHVLFGQLSAVSSEPYRGCEALSAKAVAHPAVLPHTASSNKDESMARNKRPVFGGGKGSLNVTDSRTGKQYSMEVSGDGVVKATDFKKIVAGGDGNGLKVFDKKDLQNQFYGGPHGAAGLFSS